MNTERRPPETEGEKATRLARHRAAVAARAAETEDETRARWAKDAGQIAAAGETQREEREKRMALKTKTKKPKEEPKPTTMVASLESVPAPKGGAILVLDPKKVRPTQDWRHAPDLPEDWERFKATIVAFARTGAGAGGTGVLQPIVVGLDESGGYFVKAGHRRHRACTELGVMVPAVVSNETADVKIAIVENMGRRGFRPAELADALAEARKSYPNATALALDVGLSEQYCQNLLRIKRKACPELWELFKRVGEGVNWMVLAEVVQLAPAEQVAAWNEQTAQGGKGGGKKPNARPSLATLRKELEKNEAAKGSYWEGYCAGLGFAIGSKKKRKKS
jgi:ParB/RepB/Spo0J family partition protein